MLKTEKKLFFVPFLLFLSFEVHIHLVQEIFSFYITFGFKNNN